MQAASIAMDGGIPRTELEAVFREHHSRVLQAAYRVTGNADDAQDVLQTVFLRLLRRKDSPDLKSSPASYLHRAAVNAGLDVLRARSNARSNALDDVEARLEDEREAGPQRNLEARELKARLRVALAEETPQNAEVFALRYFEGYSNQEISRMLDMSQSAVGVTLHRVRNRLKTRLEMDQGELS